MKYSDSIIGAASDQFKVGAAGADKKKDGSQEKLYCQVIQ